MSITIGQVFGSFFTKVRNAKNGQKAQHLQVKFPGGADVRTIQLVNLAGLQVNPVNNSIAITLESGPEGTLRFVVATDDFIKPTVNQGEAELYSSDGTSKLARIQVRRNGLSYIGNVGTGYNLRTIFDNFLTALATYNTAVAAATTVAQIAAAATTFGPSITTAKTQIDSVLDSGVS